MSFFKKLFMVGFDDNTNERRAIKSPDISYWECFKYQNDYSSDIEIYAFVFVGYVKTKKEADDFLKGKPVSFVKNEKGEKLQRWGGYTRLGITKDLD